MGFINWRFGAQANQQLAPLAERIAERSRSDVSRRLVGLSPEMSGAEARGYIRTRAAVVVHREVNLVLQRERRLRPADRAKLIEMATELLVETQMSAVPERSDHRFAA